MTSPLLSLNEQQWEDLCDGCGRCCMVKLQDEDDEQIYYTNVACRYLDLDTCRCTEYADRANKKPECVVLDKHNLEVLQWLPTTCAYRRFDQGLQAVKDIEEISVKGKVISEEYIHPDQFQDHVVDWIEIDSGKDA